MAALSSDALTFARRVLALEGLQAPGDLDGARRSALRWSAAWTELDDVARADVAVGLNTFWLNGPLQPQLEALDEAASGVASLDWGRASALRVKAALACFYRGAFDEAERRLKPVMQGADPCRPGTTRTPATWPLPPAAVARDAQVVLAAVYRERGEAEAGLRWAETATESAAAASDAMSAFRAGFHVAAGQLRLGRLDLAAAGFRRALKGAFRLDAGLLRTLAFANLGLACLAQGEMEDARSWLEEGAERLEARQEWLLLGKIHLELARAGGPQDSLRRARLIAERCTDAETLAEACLLSAQGMDARRARVVMETAVGDLEVLGAHPQRARLEASLRRLSRPDRTRLSISGGLIELKDPKNTKRIDLSRRPSLRRVLLRLVAGARLGRDVRAEQLVAAGWPDESPSAESGLARVYTAVRTLRKMGLAEVIVRGHEGGYRLDAEVRIGLGATEGVDERFVLA